MKNDGRRGTREQLREFLNEQGFPITKGTRRAFSYSANEPAICRIILRDGSLLSVRSSPLAVKTRTPRRIRAMMPSSCVTSSRANREASSQITTRTPLPSIRSSSVANPGRVSIGSAPETIFHLGVSGPCRPLRHEGARHAACRAATTRFLFR